MPITANAITKLDEFGMWEEQGDCGHIVGPMQVCPTCGLCIHCCTCHDTFPSFVSLVEASAMYD